MEEEQAGYGGTQPEIPALRKRCRRISSRSQQAHDQSVLYVSKKVKKN